MALSRLDIAAPPTEVFAVLADGWSYASWVVGAKVIRDVDEGFPTVGSRLHHQVGVAAATIDDVTEIVECDPPRHMALRASAGPLGQAAIVFDLDPTEVGTSISMYERPIGNAMPAKAGRRADRLLRIRNAETLWRLKVLVERRAGRRSARVSRLEGAVGDATARLFATIAVLREARGLHPRGMTLQGKATIHRAGQALATTDDVAVLVRLSRGIGLPHPLPDFNGIAVRFLDAHGPGSHQDLLLASAAAPPALRHLLLATPSFQSSGYSTVLPYRAAGGGLRLFRCERLPMRTLDDVDRALPIVLELRVASLRSAWQPAATVTVDAIVPNDAGVRFDPWHTSAALVPAGVLSRLRGPAYSGSRAAVPSSPSAPHDSR